MLYRTYIDQHGGPMLVVPQGNFPAWPCINMALYPGINATILWTEGCIYWKKKKIMLLY